ncbi:MAG TPA: C39 family peptidase [Candidatus Gallacutalibacter stercoravium]|nr:C39 family peptidase [Candidatus Gallacutalibacter stercoravium]
MKKLTKRAATLLATLLLLVAFGTQALASTIISGVPSYKQQKSNWCWVACSAMIGRFYYTYANTNQSDICHHVLDEKNIDYSSNDNLTGSYDYEISAIRYSTINRSPAPISYSMRRGVDTDYNHIVNEVNQNQPMIANVVGENAHAYVVIGCGNVAGVGNECAVMIDPIDTVWVSVDWGDLLYGYWKAELLHGELVYNAG